MSAILPTRAPPTDQPDCPHCAAERAGQRTGQMDTGCTDCRARDLARSPAAFRALRGITDTDLRDSIIGTWGSDLYPAMRKKIWEWIQRDQAQTGGGHAGAV